MLQLDCSTLAFLAPQDEHAHGILRGQRQNASVCKEDGGGTRVWSKRNACEDELPPDSKGLGKSLLVKGIVD